MNRDAEIHEYIEKHRLVAKMMLRDLVSIDSTTGRETAAQNYVRELLKSIGCNQVEEIYTKKERLCQDPEYVDSGFPLEARPNVVGMFSGGHSGEGKSLMFLCHIDTVSSEPLSNWTKNPMGEEDGPLFYGRGSCDMKGGLVAACVALKAIIDLGISLKGAVKIVSTIEEESGGGAGALALLLGGLKADAVICPEPDPKITVACAGICYFRVKVKGKSAHAGKAHQGINAIEKMNKVFERLWSLNEKRGREIHFPLFEKLSERSCHLNVGVYRAGDWPSTVPGEAELECRMSFVPGETLSDIHAIIMDCTRFDDDDWLMNNPPVVEWYGWQSNPWLQDIDHPFVKQFQGCAREVFGKDIDLVGKPSGMDTRFCGRFDMPAFNFGVQGGNIHGSDEYVEFNSIIECSKVYAHMICKWCC